MGALRSIAGLALGATAVVVLGACAGLLFLRGQVQELMGPRSPLGMRGRS